LNHCLRSISSSQEINKSKIEELQVKAKQDIEMQKERSSLEIDKELLKLKEQLHSTQPIPKKISCCSVNRPSGTQPSIIMYNLSFFSIIQKYIILRNKVWHNSWIEFFI
jgi:hypothetical protein